MSREDVVKAELADLGPRELVQLATVARRYYRDGRSKVEIAEDLNLSRFKVARMLDLAREQGLVKIDIVVPDLIDVELSKELTEAFDLRQAVVVDTPDEPIATLRADLGRVAARSLAELVQPGDVVGIAWGRTLSAMTAELRHLPRCTIVQLTGALPAANVNSNAIEVVRQLAEVSKGPAYPIFAPMLLNEAGVAQSLRKQADVAAAIGWYNRVNVALVPIGSWIPPASQIYDCLTPRERDQLLRLGVRADTSSILLSADGEVVPTTLTKRMISIQADQLRKVPEILAVAGGLAKADAIGTALKAGLVTTLITNSSVACHLLAKSRNLGGPAG